MYQPCTSTMYMHINLYRPCANHSHQHLYHTMYHKPYTISSINIVPYTIPTIHICTMSSMKNLKEPMHVPHAYITIHHEHPSTIYTQLKYMNYNNHEICFNSHKSAPHLANLPTYTISKCNTNHTKSSSGIHHIKDQRNLTCILLPRLFHSL